MYLLIQITKWRDIISDFFRFYFYHIRVSFFNEFRSVLI